MFSEDSMELWRKGIVHGASVTLGAWGMIVLLVSIALSVYQLLI